MSDTGISAAWAELRAFVDNAAKDQLGPLGPYELLQYMDELETRYGPWPPAAGSATAGEDGTVTP